MAAPLVKPLLCPILIGRAPYLAALQDCVDEAFTGHGRAVLVTSEAGIGKSRLVAEAVTYASDCSFAFLTGHCFEQDQAVPYAPLLEILRAALRERYGMSAAEALKPFASEVTRLMPEFSDVFATLGGSEPDVAYEPERQKNRFIQAFTLLLSEIANRQPLLLSVEDLQWCDEASLDALLYLARHVASRPLLLILTYRSDEVRGHLSHMLTQLDRERLAAEMQLPPLQVSEVDGMLRAIFGLAHPVPADQLNLVYGLSEGNPFFVEEMLRTVVDTRVPATPENLTGRLPLDGLRVPRTVDEAVGRRVSELSPAARHLVALAAVAGRTFTFALLQALSQQAEDRILEQLKELIAAQLVVEVSDERFAFRHALTRQAVYVGLLGRERLTLHRRMAEELEQAHDPTDDAYLGDLAYHYFKAGEWRQTLTYAERAGARALALYAPRAAIEHLMQALEAAKRLSDPRLAALHRLCGQAYEILGDFESARTHYGEALASSVSSGDRVIEWSSLVDLGNLWAGRDYAEAGAFYRRATDLAESLDDSHLHAHSLNRLGNWFANTGRTGDGIAAHRQALTLFEEREDLSGQATTFDLLGMAYGLHAELPSAIRELSRAIELFRALGNRHGLSLCLASRIGFGSGCMADTTTSALMTPGDCERDGEIAERIAREMEWSADLSYALLQIGRAEAAFGAFGSGLRHAREALRIAREIEHQQWMAAAHYALGRAYLTLLSPDRAIPELEAGLAVARNVGSEVWMGLLTADLARAYRQHGEAARSRTLLAEAFPLNALRDRNSLTLAERELALQWAQLELQHGDPEMAGSIVDRLYEQAPSRGREQPLTELLLLRGEALMRLRRWDEAKEALEEARRGATQRMNPSSLWRAHGLLARVYQTTKHLQDARREWEAALTIVEGLAATIEEDDVRAAFLRAGQVNIPRDARTQHTPLAALQLHSPLTRRELEVARLVAQGKSNHDIAGTLVLSERTVTTHITHILGKLGFTSRTQIATWLVMGAPESPSL